DRVTGPTARAPLRPAPTQATRAAPAMAAPHDVSIKVRVMGEGIRAVRIVSLLKQPGDAIALDETLCGVETDKAIYPIESSFAGVLKEWHCKKDDILNIGDEVGVVTTTAETAPSAFTPSTASPPEPLSTPRPPALSIQQLQQLPRAELAPHAAVPPALSPAITRR